MSIRLVSAEEVGLHRHRHSLNLDSGGLLGHFQLHGDGGNFAGIHHDAGHVNRVKSRLSDRDVIFAEREILKNELTG